MDGKFYIDGQEISKDEARKIFNNEIANQKEAGQRPAFIQYNSPLIAVCFTQDKFSDCKTEEGGVAVATSTDDNAADGNLDK